MPMVFLPGQSDPLTGLLYLMVEYHQVHLSAISW